MQALTLEPALVDAAALLDRLDHPVWIFDIDRGRVHWANAEAVRMWQAESLEDLRARAEEECATPQQAEQLGYAVAQQLIAQGATVEGLMQPDAG